MGDFLLPRPLFWPKPASKYRAKAEETRAEAAATGLLDIRAGSARLAVRLLLLRGWLFSR